MRRSSTLGLLAASAALLAACSSVPDGALEAQALECPPGEPGCDEILPVGPGGEMTVIGGEFYFDVQDGLATTGEIEMTLINEGAAFHNIEVIGAAEGSGIAEADGGDEGSATVLLFPGEWRIICNVPGHEAAGMVATVQVFATEEELEEAEAEGVDPDELEPTDEGGGGETDAGATIDDI